MNETVLVSGGSGGIGSALARQLAKAGYRPVVGFATNRPGAESVARVTEGAALPLNLTDTTAIDGAIETLAAEKEVLVAIVARYGGKTLGHGSGLGAISPDGSVR